ncbi:MAG: DUF3786 domain-containing protein [Desulfobacterales bacterium]|nr:DUF3786 domain-containing protein [Desulfobacterales bacterium]MCP4162078.1 DUF3786 domain-containing protein [Deltaproteobacteria bacterium]
MSKNNEPILLQFFLDKLKNNKLFVNFLDNTYCISKDGIKDASENVPDYRICIILAKYILLCPRQLDPDWVSFKDFKREAHFANVNFFSSEAEQVIVRRFSGKKNKLLKACIKADGFKSKVDLPYDLSIQFNVLPRISLLLLFNDNDEEFSAQCIVLFQKHSEFYLDPESLAIAGSMLSKKILEAA